MYFQPGSKVLHILDVWSGGMGVVSLHCFQNVIPVEAYTREACMIDALGKETHLTSYVLQVFLFAFYCRFFLKRTGLHIFISYNTQINE